MSELYESATACFTYLDSLSPLTSDVQAVGDTLQSCFELVTAIHNQPWLLGGFPYPLVKSLLEFSIFHGVLLLMTKLFTMGL